MSLPLRNPESTADPTPLSDDVTARFERDAVPLLDQLYRVARRYTRCHSDAEDLVQETMIKAYSGFPTFKEGNIRAWLFKIMTHTWINTHRVAKRRPAEWLTGDVGDSFVAAGFQQTSARLSSAEVQALDSMGDDEVREALQTLPEAQRLAIYYADVEGLRYREIAEILDMPLGSVMSRIHRGRRSMRKLLRDFAVDRGYIRGGDDVELAA